jgi:hypothetical protein
MWSSGVTCARICASRIADFSYAPAEISATEGLLTHSWMILRRISHTVGSPSVKQRRLQRLHRRFQGQVDAGGGRSGGQSVRADQAASCPDTGGSCLPITLTSARGPATMRAM